MCKKCSNDNEKAIVGLCGDAATNPILRRRTGSDVAQAEQKEIACLTPKWVMCDGVSLAARLD